MTNNIARWSFAAILSVLLTSCALSTRYEPAAESSAPPYLPGRDAPVSPAPPKALQKAPAAKQRAIEEVVVSASRVAGDRDRDARQARSIAPRVRHFSSSVMPGEELWIIARALPDTTQVADDDHPGSGAMVTYIDGSPEYVPLPLRKTVVDAAIDGYISTVQVTQKFENPFSSKIEAVYMFPLPEKAAVNEFVMAIGERRIRGILRDKQEAQAIYEQARAQGYRASLLVQHRPNIFEQKVANIEPGKAIDVDITYFHTLAYVDGWYEFVFPTVVGPRYNPPNATDAIGAVARGTQHAGTAVRYLRPKERSAHDIDIDVTINAGVRVQQLEASHAVRETRTAQALRVSLAAERTMPNRDFVLRYRVAGRRLGSQLLTYMDDDRGEGYFTLMLYPPQVGVQRQERRAMEMVFVLDCSGSMSGTPLQQAKTAVAGALDQLTPRDTFQIIRFSDNASHFGHVPVAATKENVAAARRYLRNLQGKGGTRMVKGIEAALSFPHDEQRLRFVSFMTDGYIGNERDILNVLHRHIGESRVFSFGVGSSVNRYLLERMAKVGRGAAAFLGPRDSGAKIMDDFFSRISRPALTDLQIDWGGMIVSEVYPARLPDLFAGRPLFVTGKYVGSTDRITVSGVRGGRDHLVEIENADERRPAALPQLWARLKIAELSDQQAVAGDPHGELGATIKSTALAYRLMSAYTSFVAVDASRATDGGYGTTVNQAVPVPSGVRYSTTVTN